MHVDIKIFLPLVGQFSEKTPLNISILKLIGSHFKNTTKFINLKKHNI
jgi:hypothetical protein